MARIRTIKPEFFRHEGLFEAERDTRLPLRVAFAGLWCIADKAGRFRWRPREIQLDVLPYDKIDMSRVLDALTTRGFLVHYACGTEEYGCIPSWSKHQFVNNREHDSTLPDVSTGQVITHASATREARDNDASATRHPRVPHRDAGSAVREGERKGRGKDIASSDASTEDAASAAADDPPSEDQKLYHAVEESFLSRNDGKFSNYGKEGKAIHALIGKARARAPDNTGPFLQTMLEAFWQLKQTGNAFWQGQPFLPSALNASGIWDRVLETMRNHEAAADPEALAIASGEIF